MDAKCLLYVRFSLAVLGVDDWGSAKSPPLLDEWP